jgi:hypothetical protein
VIQIREIIALTALNFDLEAMDLLGRSKEAKPLLARRVAMYLARRRLGASTIVIGKAFGGRDHSSVITALEHMESALSDPKLKALVHSMEAEFDMRERLEAMGGVDVLSVARRVAARPSRNAIGVTVMETAALAATVLDLWEIAEAAVELAGLLQRRTEIFQGEWAEATSDDVDDLDCRTAELGAAIMNCMAALSGETPETERLETDNGSSHP